MLMAKTQSVEKILEKRRNKIFYLYYNPIHFLLRDISGNTSRNILCIHKLYT